MTFTEAAAAELRKRISTKLLTMDRVEDALRLDQAYISTIHGFGLRIMTEFAFEGGTSPKPRLLNEYEEEALIRQALSRTDKADEIISKLKDYGYSRGYRSSAEDNFRAVLSRIVDLLRSLGWQAYSDDYANQAAEWISERYGPTSDGDKLSADLLQRIDALLESYPDSLVREYGTNDSAGQRFSQ